MGNAEAQVLAAEPPLLPALEKAGMRALAEWAEHMLAYHARVVREVVHVVARRMIAGAQVAALAVEGAAFVASMVGRGNMRGHQHQKHPQCLRIQEGRNQSGSVTRLLQLYKRLRPKTQEYLMELVERVSWGMRPSDQPTTRHTSGVRTTQDSGLRSQDSGVRSQESTRQESWADPPT